MGGVVAVNQFGVWASMKHQLRVMRAQGSGAIVNNSSLGRLIGLPQRAAYHGNKHAVIGRTKSAGVKYAPRDIRINALYPGTLGGVDKFEPVSGCSDMDHTEEVFGELVVSGGDGAVDFQATEEAFDVIAFLVERPVVLDLDPSV